MKEILVPPSPGILCALGLLVSDLREDFVKTVRADLTPDRMDDIAASIDALFAEADVWAAREGVDVTRRYEEVTLDLRFVGQNFELSVPIGRRTHSAPMKIPPYDVLRRVFFEAHDKAYGFHNAEAAIELINVRLSAGRTSAPILLNNRLSASGRAPREIGRQLVHFTADDCHDTPIYNRATFAPGLSFEGPAIISQFDSTTVIFPGDRVVVDDSLNLVIEVQR